MHRGGQPLCPFNAHSNDVVCIRCSWMYPCTLTLCTVRTHAPCTRSAHRSHCARCKPQSLCTLQTLVRKLCNKTMYGTERDSLSSLTQKLENEVRENRACLQKIKRDWQEVRTSMQVDARAEALSESLSTEVDASLAQVWDFFSKERAVQTEELEAVQSNIYVDSLWVTERLEELADLQHRAAKLGKTLGL